MRSVLVTGATGFIGREVVRLLANAGRPVVALVRERSPEQPADRLARALGGAFPHDAITIVPADLARPDTLASADLERLRATVETVIHCAGDPTFHPASPTEFRAGHVGGPQALLERLAGGRLRRWLQVSTAFVCGRRRGTVLETEGDVGQTFHNVYERVKLDAELALRAAAEVAGVDLRVARPSIVIGAAPRTGGGTPSAAVFDFIRLVMALPGRGAPVRIAAAPSARFHVVPVDHVGPALVVLADHPCASRSTFHVVAGSPTQEELLAMIAGRLGTRGLRLVAHGALADPSPTERRVDRVLAPYRDYLTLDVSFDDAHARAVLDAAGFPRPVIDNLAVERLVDLALAGRSVAEERRAPEGRWAPVVAA